MTSFTLVKAGQTVFDKSRSVSGIVLSIDRETNTARIKTKNSSGGVDTSISNLVDLVQVSIQEESEEEDSEGLNKAYELVKEFHEEFSHPVANEPVQMNLIRATYRSVWTGEEALVEFLHASAANEEEFDSSFNKMIDGLHKAKEKSLAMEYYNDGIDTVVAQADALTDALYFIFGSFVELGVQPDKLFEIVQSSNMSKLFTDENGNKYAKYRESDGKILKSDNFFPPEPALKAEIERQFKLK